ncbi:MAG: phasin family protein [Magnetococcales bacterium]|nr:phasin family protein [Magnetococcales bacterium]
MDKKVAEQMTEMTKAVLNSMMRLQQINERTVQKLAERQLDAVGEYMSAGVQQLRMMGESKDMKDVLGKQAELTKELSDRMVTHAKQTVELLNQSRREINDLMEKGMEAILGQAKDGAE